VIDVRRTGIVKSGLLPRQSDFAFRAADCRSPPVPEFLYTHNKKRKRNTKVLASSTTQQTHTQTFFWKRKKRRRTRGKRDSKIECKAVPGQKDTLFHYIYKRRRRLGEV
jgi:hypothetical protein